MLVMSRGGRLEPEVDVVERLFRGNVISAIVEITFKHLSSDGSDILLTSFPVLVNR
jgi:hypothetical protein